VSETEAGQREEFKQRLAAVMADLNGDGIRSAPAMLTLGHLAHGIAEELRVASWPKAKATMNMRFVRALLSDFGTHMEAHQRAGRINQAYAIQALSMSILARSHADDPVVAQGEQLIDTLIERAIALYRQQPPAKSN
jgi:hypothetical protein